MDTQNIELIYQKVVDKLDEMIPELWDQIYLYAEPNDGASTVSFYYSPQGKKKFEFSSEIIKRFSINKNEFYNHEYQLCELFEELQNEFKKNNQEVWTNLTLSIDSNGKFKVEYDYTDLSEADDYERQIIWEYKYLDTEPPIERERDRKIIENYLNQLENK